MPIKAYRSGPFRYTHENRAFDKLYRELESVWGQSDELVVLLGNFYCGGRELDAAVLRCNSITLIDFKNYGGRIKYSENGPWCADDVQVGGGSKANPFLQLRAYKHAFIDFVKGLNISPVGKYHDFTHVGAMVIFAEPIVFVENQIQGSARPWFHVTDSDRAIGRLSQVYSSQINLSQDEIRGIVAALEIPEYVPVGTESSSVALERKSDLVSANPSAKQSPFAIRRTWPVIALLALALAGIYLLYHIIGPKPDPPGGYKPPECPKWDDNCDGYISCTEARRHGIAPVRRGHPAYKYMNDADQDGIVCESIPRDPVQECPRWDDNCDGYISCAEARRHGIAPVRRGHPAYKYMNDADQDGIVCESIPRDPVQECPRWDDNCDGYISCTEARRHGIAPVRRGHPAYKYMNDADQDGIVCESIPRDPVQECPRWDDNCDGYISCAEARRHGIAPVRRGHPAYKYMNDADQDGIVCESIPRDPVQECPRWDDNCDGYISCAEARRHGIAPVRRGHPAYKYMNDADQDGIVCESIPRDPVQECPRWDDNCDGYISCAEARRHGIAPVRRGHPAYKYMNDADQDGIVCE